MVMVSGGSGGGGGGGSYERPDPGMHLAVWAHTYEVGVHEREWKGVKKRASMLCIVWELEAQTSKGKPHLMFDVVPASTYGKSKMREALEAALRRPLTQVEIDRGVDTSQAEKRVAVLTLTPGQADPSKRFIGRRDPVQDAKRSLAVIGKYGPAEVIPGYVWSVMQSALPGTVREGQGTPPTPRAEAPPSAPTPAAAPTAQPGNDDLPF